MTCTRCARRAQGVCLDCGEEPRAGCRRCDICLEKKRQSVTRHRERMRARRASTMRKLREVRAS